MSSSINTTSAKEVMSDSISGQHGKLSVIQSQNWCTWQERLEFIKYTGLTEFADWWKFKDRYGIHYRIAFNDKTSKLEFDTDITPTQYANLCSWNDNPEDNSKNNSQVESNVVQVESNVDQVESNVDQVEFNDEWSDFDPDTIEYLRNIDNDDTD